MKMVLGAAHTWHAISGHRMIDVGSLYGALRSSYRGSSSQLFGEVSFPDLIGRMAAALDGGALDDGTSGDGVDKTHASQNNFDKGVRTGRPFSWMVEPFVRLAWLHAGMQGFTEQGGAAALNVRPANNSVLFSTLGLKLTHAFETNTGAAEIQSRLGWRHASGSVHPVSRQSFRDSANQTVFESEGQPVPRSAWLFELGVKAGLAKNVSLGLAYAGQFASRVQDHGAKVSMAWVF
jgi:subtilase-type serine protease